jgi:cell division protease FtsH
LKKVDGLDTEFLAQTQASGADIANVCNEAALIAARYDKTFDKQDFRAPIENRWWFREKNKIVTQEKRKQSLSKAGHATVSWMLEHAPTYKSNYCS